MLFSFYFYAINNSVIVSMTVHVLFDLPLYVHKTISKRTRLL